MRMIRREEMRIASGNLEVDGGGIGIQVARKSVRRRR
jgi:hypothetical protein